MEGFEWMFFELRMNNDCICILFQQSSAENYLRCCPTDGLWREHEQELICRRFLLRADAFIRLLIIPDLYVSLRPAKSDTTVDRESQMCRRFTVRCYWECQSVRQSSTPEVSHWCLPTESLHPSMFDRAVLRRQFDCSARCRCSPTFRPRARKCVARTLSSTRRRRHSDRRMSSTEVKSEIRETNVT